MTFSRPAKGLLFDMDGLLLDTERLGLRVFFRICDSVGIAPSKAEPFFLALIGGAPTVNAAKVSQFFDHQMTIAQFHNQWVTIKEELMQDGVPMRPFAFEVVTGLAEQQIKMAVVTSTPGDVARHELQRAGLLDCFQLVIGGDEVSANKPDPAPYFQGAAALGLAAEDCGAFEDSDTGITAAVRAGCMAVQIPDLRPENVDVPQLGQPIASDLRAAVALFDFANVAPLV